MALQRSVLHRDLKSLNCFVAHDFSVKVGDFGDALLMGSSAAIDAANDDDLSTSKEPGGVADGQQWLGC